ncbi:MAG: helix-turn-helix domain-containing protein [Bacillota bacterium]
MTQMLDKKDHENILRFISDIQDYSVDFRSGVLQYLTSIFSFRHVTFILFDESEKMTDLIAINISDRLLKLYKEYYYKTDLFHPRNFPCGFKLDSNKPIVTNADLMPQNNYENTEFYRDFLKLENLYSQTVLYLRKNNRLIGAIGIQKSKDEGMFSDRELGIIHAVTPFISNFLYDYLEITRLQREQQLYKNCLMQAPAGIVLLDSNYSVLMYNKLALEYCKDIQGGSSHAIDAINHFIRFILANLVARREISSVSISSAHQCYVASIDSIMTPDVQKGIETYYAIYIHTYVPSGICDLGEKAATYNLTEREIEIIGLIAQGLNNKEISARLYISYNTVRTHVGNIMTKMNVGNRTAILNKLEIVNDQSFCMIHHPV